jgi:four helix bundle protein
MKDFRDLRVWNEAHQLTLAIYRATSRFPRQELYGLTSQMRRCSVSIGANIAEGCGKRGNNEFQRFLVIASGSASELDYELLLANDLEYLDQQAYCSLHEDLSRLRRMLTSLLQKVDEERFVAKCQVLIQNLVPSVKLKSRTFIAATTMSNDSSPQARTGELIDSTLDSIAIKL